MQVYVAISTSGGRWPGEHSGPRTEGAMVGGFVIDRCVYLPIDLPLFYLSTYLPIYLSVKV